MIDRLSLNQMKQQQSVGTRVCIYNIGFRSHKSVDKFLLEKKKRVESGPKFNQTQRMVLMLRKVARCQMV